MVDLVGPLTRPLGPLPVWGWAALGGGALFLFAAHRNPGGTAAAVVNPNVATPAPPGSAGGGSAGGGATGGTGTGTGTGTDTGSGGTDTGGAPGITAKDLFGGGTLGSFLAGLGPNYQQFNLSSGPTSVGVQNSAQNILDEQNAEATLAANVTARQNEIQGALAARQNELLAAIAAQQQGNNYTLAYRAGVIPNGYQYNQAAAIAPIPIIH